MNSYGYIRFAQVPERVSTKSFVVLIRGNSMSNHLGAQSTFNHHPVQSGLTPNSACTRYSFTSRLLCTNQPSVHPSCPPALPTLVQYYCTTIGQYMTLLPTSRVYAIHHTILVITISCKGQPLTPPSQRLVCFSPYDEPAAVRAELRGPARPADCTLIRTRAGGHAMAVADYDGALPLIEFIQQ